MKILKGRGQEYKGVFITDKFDKHLDDWLTEDNVTFNKTMKDRPADARDFILACGEFEMYFDEFKSN